MGLRSWLARKVGKWQIKKHVNKHARRIAQWAVAGSLSVLASGKYGEFAKFLSQRVDESSREDAVVALTAFVTWAVYFIIDGVQSWRKVNRKD